MDGSKKGLDVARLAPDYVRAIAAYGSLPR